MIIFFDNQGNIKGTIDGRIHPQEHLAMSVDDENGTPYNKLVIPWIPVAFFDKEDDLLDAEKIINEDQEEMKKSFAAEFEPDHPQKELLEQFDKKSSLVYNYQLVFDQAKQIYLFQEKVK